MTSVVAGGIFNAFAFAGAGYLFQKFNKDGYSEETKRHHLALEQLEKARQEWSQKDIERQEKIANLRQERSDTNDLSDEMKEYMTLAIGTMGLVGGWTGEKIISKLFL